jgi:glycosyltransferase involved in cell wall biosynthesis
MRILMVMHMMQARDAGAPRVQLELADELRRLGCEVEVLAETSQPAGRLAEYARAGFWRRAVPRVAAVAQRFDVVDAHHSNLPVPKQRLGLDGLLVARSSGLAPFYHDFDAYSRRRWPESRSGVRALEPVRRWRGRQLLRAALRSLRHADLINVPNAAEAEWLDEHCRYAGKTVVIPNGIPAPMGALFERGAQPPEERLREPMVAFIGDWSLRKGSADWPAIVRGVRLAVPEARFRFLGTLVPEDVTRRALGDPPGVEVVERYRPDELPALLAPVTVGALPSYAEGFGLGVVEKLASGIPTVAYDVGGPRSILSAVDDRLLVPVGDAEKLASRIADLLRMDVAPYGELAGRCIAAARPFHWNLIAERTLEVYEDRLAALRGGSASG